MRRATLARLVFLAAALAAAGAPVSADEPSRGHLLLNGGGGEASDYWPKFFELAGGRERPIVILPTASERPEAGQEYVDEVAALGATNLSWLPLRSREDAEKPEILAALEKASGIFFTGGDQSRITAAVLGTKAETVLANRLRDGAVIGGSSAGLACMSEKMLTGEGDFSLLAAGNVELKPGLGYVREAILDQHFVARSRQNRLLSVVMENPALLGVGVDERTTIWIRPDRTFEVLGDGWVMVFDARASQIGRRAGESPVPLSADGITTRILVRGDRFDLATGRLLPRR